MPAFELPVAIWQVAWSLSEIQPFWCEAIAHVPFNAATGFNQATDAQLCHGHLQFTKIVFRFRLSIVDTG